jgi:hypothetical protein
MELNVNRGPYYKAPAYVNGKRSLAPVVGRLASASIHRMCTISGVMIRLAILNGTGTIKLLKQQCAAEFMRQGHF